MNRMMAPPTPTGLQQAFQLLAILNDKDQLQSILDNIQKYVVEAEKYFAAYEGLEGANEAAYQTKVKADEEAGILVSKATKLSQQATLELERVRKLEAETIQKQKDAQQSKNEADRYLNEAKSLETQMRKDTAALQVKTDAVNQQIQTLNKREAELNDRAERMRQAADLVA